MTISGCDNCDERNKQGNEKENKRIEGYFRYDDQERTLLGEIHEVMDPGR